MNMNIKTMTPERALTPERMNKGDVRKDQQGRAYTLGYFERLRGRGTITEDQARAWERLRDEAHRAGVGRQVSAMNYARESGGPRDMSDWRAVRFSEVQGLLSSAGVTHSGILTLCVIQDISAPEAALRLGITKAMARKRLQAALDWLVVFYKG